jgi:hypothetical protein
MYHALLYDDVMDFYDFSSYNLSPQCISPASIHLERKCFFISYSSNGLYTPSLASRSTAPDSRHRKLFHRPASYLAIRSHPWVTICILTGAVSMSSGIKPTIPPRFEHGGE